MKYPQLSALIFLTMAISTHTMEKESKPKNKPTIKLRSLSHGNESLEKLKNPDPETPGKRPSPTTDKALEEWDKKNTLPSPRPGSPKTSPRVPLMSPRVASPRFTSPRRSATTNSYPGIEITRALSNTTIKPKLEEKK